VEQESLTLLEHRSSPPIFSGFRVTRSLVLCVCFVDRCLSFCTFYFGHCVVCSSSIYGFWLPLWYLQTLPNWYLFKMSKRKQSRIADFFRNTSIHTKPETIYMILIYVKQCKNDLCIYLLFTVIVFNVTYRLNVCQSAINQVYCSICLFIIILLPTPYLLLSHLA
jgi:hypothetical protein